MLSKKEFQKAIKSGDNKRIVKSMTRKEKTFLLLFLREIEQPGYIKSTVNRLKNKIGLSAASAACC